MNTAAMPEVISRGDELDRLCINTIRTLAIDAIQKAKSGHPGTPMGMAPVAYALWQNRLNFDPAARDHFRHGGGIHGFRAPR